MKNRHQAAALAIISIVLLLLALIPMVSVFAELGTNWTATYYASTDLSGAVAFTETLPSGINVNWGTGSPNPAVPSENFSARFTSTQLFNAGTYEFVISSDDGVRVFIDSVMVLDRFIGRVLTTDRFQQTLTAGTHALTVEYVEFLDQAALSVQWFQVGGTPGVGTTPGVSTAIVPTQVGQCTGTCATVTGVRGLALRTGPYLGASFVTTLAQDQSFPVIGRNKDEGIYSWYRLQVGDRVGWASGRYLTLTVDANSVPLTTSVFDTIDGTADIGARAYPRAVMNLRARPSTRMGKIGSIPWGAPLELIGRTVQAGQNQWLQVRYNSDSGSMVGWIDARWVTIQGEIYNVPIR